MEENLLFRRKGRNQCWLVEEECRSQRKQNNEYSLRRPCAHTFSVPPVLSDSLWSHGLGPPGSSSHGTFPAKILEWIVRPSSRGSSRPRDQTHISCISWTSGIFFTAESPETFYQELMLNCFNRVRLLGRGKFISSVYVKTFSDYKYEKKQNASWCWKNWIEGLTQT